MSRPENGAMRFDDDWAGVFIRGDNAMHYSMLLRHAVEATKGNQILSIQLNGLANLLQSCREPCPQATAATMAPSDEATP